jgi:DNA-binding NarL/FixJ family response regulator
MDRICCLAGIAPREVPLLATVLTFAGLSIPGVIARLEVPELSRLNPGILIADVDRLDVDPFELLRQIRFVLPECIIVIYTSTGEASWARECHLAGANCLLSKDSNRAQLVSGLRSAIKSGCFTDPRLSASA